jgi:hypothetical protein
MIIPNDKKWTFISNCNPKIPINIPVTAVNGIKRIESTHLENIPLNIGNKPIKNPRGIEIRIASR